MIEELVNRLAKMGEWTSAASAVGPGAPKVFAAETARLLEQFPFAERADDWLAFLRKYGGGMLTRERDLLSLGLYGFSEDVTMPILDGPGDPIDAGCLVFGDVEVPLVGSADETVALGFGFDATGKRKWGVYRIEDSAASRYCESFTEWLRRFVELDGRLID
jgi:hypothetical protein